VEMTIPVLPASSQSSFMEPENSTTIPFA
jgi:hypothetical protein